MANTPQFSAVNPKTGERVVWNGQQWTPAAPTPRVGRFPAENVDREAAQKDISQAAADAKLASRILPQIDTFDAVNRHEATGPVYGDLFGFSPGQMTRDLVDQFSPLGFVNPQLSGQNAIADRGQMKAISASLTPQQRPPGSGATSDFEQRLYARGVPSIDKVGQTNQRVSEYMREQALRAVRYNDFLQRYYAANGHTVGVDEAFNRAEAAANRLAPSYGQVYGQPNAQPPAPQSQPAPVDRRSVLKSKYGLE